MSGARGRRAGGLFGARGCHPGSREGARSSCPRSGSGTRGGHPRGCGRTRGGRPRSGGRARGGRPRSGGGTRSGCQHSGGGTRCGRIRAGRWGTMPAEAHRMVQCHALCSECYSACWVLHSSDGMQMCCSSVGCDTSRRCTWFRAAEMAALDAPPSTLLNPATPLVHRRREAERTRLGWGAAGGRHGGFGDRRGVCGVRGCGG